MAAGFIAGVLLSRGGPAVGVALHERHADQQDHHQDEGNGGGEVEVVGHVLALDRVADQVELADFNKTLPLESPPPRPPFRLRQRGRAQTPSPEGKAQEEYLGLGGGWHGAGRTPQALRRQLPSEREARNKEKAKIRAGPGGGRLQQPPLLPL